MPSISMFYGIVIYMYQEVNNKHHQPHIHANYSGENVVVNFEGEVLSGSFPKKQLQLLTAWIVIHKEELEANWRLLEAGEQTYRIAPLK